MRHSMLVIVGALVACLLLLIAGVVHVRAQTTAPYLEGTSTCPTVLVWFADAAYRRPSKNSTGLSPQLVLFNGDTVDQAVTVRVSSALGVVSQVYAVAAKARKVVDVGTELLGGRSADLSLEVEFAGLGMADLKVWSGSTAITVVPLTLCR
jgi:hypothetical protein